MFKKIITTLLFVSIQLLSSSAQQNRLQDDLFDNGILGRGFIAKTEQALKREEILTQTRNENALIQHCRGCEKDQTLSEEDYDVSICITTSFVKVLSEAVNIMGRFLGDAKDQTKKNGNNSQLILDKKVSSEKVFICNPVIKSIMFMPPDIVSRLGGTVKLRSKLHHLREKFDYMHSLEENQKSDFPYDEQNELFGIKDDLLKDTYGILVEYTDRQWVRIRHNPQHDCCEYSIIKGK